MESSNLFWTALTFQAGYNSTIVAIGATTLGACSGLVSSFLYLRKRALVADALAHATLPGLVVSFLIMVWLGHNGQNLAGLMLGAAFSALAGVLVMEAITRYTRLYEDAAIGVVLSVFFGFGVVLLSYAQTLPTGRSAGLDQFLLGSTAGMLRADAQLVVLSALLCLGVLMLFQRVLTLHAFDPDFARSVGLSSFRVDLVLMGLVLATTVIGLRIVGLVMIVALLIIPAVAARLWTERSRKMGWIAASIGALAGWWGTAVSTAFPNMPTGPIIVLVASALFAISLIIAPARGILPGLWHRRKLHRRVHIRQGLLALASGAPILERYTQNLMISQGWMRRDGVITPSGQRAASEAELDALRWRVAQRHYGEMALFSETQFRAIEEVFTKDEIATIDAEIDKRP